MAFLETSMVKFTRWHWPYFDIVRNINHVQLFSRMLHVTWSQLIGCLGQVQLDEVFLCWCFQLQVTCGRSPEVLAWKRQRFTNDWITDNTHNVRANEAAESLILPVIPVKMMLLGFRAVVKDVTPPYVSVAQFRSSESSSAEGITSVG